MLCKAPSSLWVTETMGCPVSPGQAKGQEGGHNFSLF